MHPADLFNSNEFFHSIFMANSSFWSLADVNYLYQKKFTLKSTSFTMNRPWFYDWYAFQLDDRKVETCELSKLSLWFIRNRR